MGMDYYLIAKNEDIQDDLRFSEIENSLDRPMNAFIDGEEAYGKNSEYNQIERLFEIDLSPFQVFNNHGYFLHFESVEGEMDWKLLNKRKIELKNIINQN